MTTPNNKSNPFTTNDDGYDSQLSPQLGIHNTVPTQVNPPPIWQEAAAGVGEAYDQMSKKVVKDFRGYLDNYIDEVLKEKSLRSIEADGFSSQMTEKSLGVFVELIVKSIHKEHKRLGIQSHEVDEICSQMTKHILGYWGRLVQEYIDYGLKIRDVQRQEEWVNWIVESSKKRSGKIKEDVQSSLSLNNSLSLDMMCINCRSQPANMLLLPCRHVCSCYSCVGSLMVCPICNSPKMANVKLNLLGSPSPYPEQNHH